MVEIELDGVPARLIVKSGIIIFVGLDNAFHFRFRRRRIFAGEIGAYQFRLLLCKIDQRRQGLRQSHIEQVGHAGFHDALEQGRRAVVAVSQKCRVVEKGEADVIAGGPDDYVHTLAATIGEDHAVAIEPFDPGFHGEVA